MNKNIVICLDGTWKKDEPEGDDNTETNIRNLYEMCLNDAAEQVAYYDAGVGSNWYDRLRGGISGAGLSQNIREAYLELSRQYQEGDKVFIFGFSRGAYTARSLAGFIYCCGLVPRNKANEKSVDDVFDIYKKGDREDRKRCKESNITCLIEMIGVWDTVGSLGIPISFFSDLNDKLFEFHDTKLNREVKAAYHALAIDEQRGTFEPTLWKETNRYEGQILEQVWFAGVHSDVGGGYKDRSHSDITFKWMLEKAVKAHGLKILSNNGYKFNINLENNVHDSFKRIFGAKEPRKIPQSAQIHCSVREKMKLQPGYNPQALGDLENRSTLTRIIRESTHAPVGR